jgi:hypothetical protein
MLTAATILAVRDPDRIAETRSAGRAALLSPDDSVRPALLRALLEDAMLTPGDMPPGWTESADGRRSPLARRYGGLLIGESCASFAADGGGARLTQHVGILPRPAAILTSDVGRSDCDRLSRRNELGRRHPGLVQEQDVLLLRRRQLVMALVRSLDGCGGRDEETTAAALTAVARWTALADALA